MLYGQQLIQPHKGKAGLMVEFVVLPESEGQTEEQLLDLENQPGGEIIPDNYPESV